MLVESGATIKCFTEDFATERHSGAAAINLCYSQEITSLHKTLAIGLTLWHYLYVPAGSPDGELS